MANVFFLPQPLDSILAAEKLPSRGAELSPMECKNTAFWLAYRGAGHVSPNPMVGCVIVDRNHRFLAAGAHMTLGAAHAEANALKGLSESALKDATVYVTLEPCAHEGKTPSCAKTMAQLPLAKVVFGATDTNPQVSGEGAAILEAAGIEVVQDRRWAAQVQRQNRVFFHHMATGQLYWAMKVGCSLDGTTALQGDSRAWITNERSRSYGHFLRMLYDAILVGWRTVLLDNPSLNVRYGWSRPRTPLRVITDPEGRAFAAIQKGELNLIQSEPEQTLWVVSPDFFNAHRHPIQEIVAKGVQVTSVPYDREHGFHLQTLSDCLLDMNCRSCLLEGGAETYRFFLQQRRVNFLHMFQSPKLFFGGQRLPWNTVETPLPQVEMRIAEVSQLDDNWLVEGDLGWHRDEL